MGLFNAFLVAIACYHTFRVRYATPAFSLSHYIGLAVFLMAQAFSTGIPFVTVVLDIPEVFYLVLTSVILVLCRVLLLLMFFCQRWRCN